MAINQTQTLHERIAAELGWPIEEVRTISLPSLRTLLPAGPLKDELGAMIMRGEHLVR